MVDIYPNVILWRFSNEFCRRKALLVDAEIKRLVPNEENRELVWDVAKAIAEKHYDLKNLIRIKKMFYDGDDLVEKSRIVAKFLLETTHSSLMPQSIIAYLSGDDVEEDDFEFYTKVTYLKCDENEKEIGYYHNCLIDETSYHVSSIINKSVAVYAFTDFISAAKFYEDLYIGEYWRIDEKLCESLK